MVEYSKASVKLTDKQLKKLKTAVKSKTETTLRMSLKMFNGDDLPHELLLTIRQKIQLRNAFNNNMSTDIKLSKAQISKIIQSWRSLGSLLSKLAGLLMKVADLWVKNMLAPLGITAAASAINAGIQNKIHGLGTTTLIISNDELNHIMKMLKLLKVLIFWWKELLIQLKTKQKNNMENFYACY